MHMVISVTNLVQDELCTRAAPKCDYIPGTEGSSVWNGPE